MFSTSPLQTGENTAFSSRELSSVRGTQRRSRPRHLRCETRAIDVEREGVGGKPRVKPHRFAPLSNDKNGQRCSLTEAEWKTLVDFLRFTGLI